MNESMKRTYLIPVAVWLLCALYLFQVGWFLDAPPPTSLGLFEFEGEAPPCCWTAYDCEIEVRELMKYFDDTCLPLYLPTYSREAGLETRI